MRSLTLLLSLVCLILIVAHRARGFSSGAPEESCDSLTVNHTHVGSQSPGAECDPPCLTRQLRLIGSSADSFIYNCNETYQLQLTTTADVSLNGYMVAPREDTGAPLDGNVPYVGSWENGADMKLLCNGSAVTQTRILVQTTTVNMTWKAPIGGRKNVAFWLVIVPSIAFYYLPIKSLTATPNPAECPCNPICLNSGTINEKPCKCDCPDYYIGDNCENCSRNCQNGGTLNEETCLCDCEVGFSGDNCEICRSRNCQIGGVLNVDTCTCDCADGYSGDTCGTCALTCMNGGTLNETTCTCDCADGYSGDNCEICKSRNCQIGGVLNVDTCTCDCADGYSGDTCEICSRACQNGGTLDAESCKCDCSGARGFGGPNCEICKSRNCQNGGVLNADTCTCDCADGYSGDSCEIDIQPIPPVSERVFGSDHFIACALMCQNGGTRNETTCTCDCADGYCGDTCGSVCIADTQPIPTVNEGVFGTEQFIGIVAGAVAFILVLITIVTISTVVFCVCLRRVKP